MDEAFMAELREMAVRATPGNRPGWTAATAALCAGLPSICHLFSIYCLRMKLFLCTAFAATTLFAQPQLGFLNHNRPVVDAHNCYPYEGRWADRIDRALKAGFPVAIEQDIAWANGRPVVSQFSKTTGTAPALRDHFFERVRPIMEQALAKNDVAHWPLIILHFDFKTLDPRTL